MDEKLTLLFEGQKLTLKSGFVGGFLADFTGAPMGMYIGKLDMGDCNIALVHLLRAVIKLTNEELHMNPQQSKSFIEFALAEALKREKENKNIDNATLEQHELVVKMRRDN